MLKLGGRFDSLAPILVGAFVRLISLPTSPAMLSEWELWACANHFIRRHQDDAPVIAAMRADELLAAGDIEGAHTFTAIVERINRLLAAPTGPLH